MAEDIPDDAAPLGEKKKPLKSRTNSDLFFFYSALRQKRLGHDLRGLLSDASEGIRAKPLDSSYYHW